MGLVKRGLPRSRGRAKLPSPDHAHVGVPGTRRPLAWGPTSVQAGVFFASCFLKSSTTEGFRHDNKYLFAGACGLVTSAI